MIQDPWDPRKQGRELFASKRARLQHLFQRLQRVPCSVALERLALFEVKTQRLQALQDSTSTAAATLGARAQGAHTAGASRPRSRTYMTDKEAREDLFRSLDRSFDKSRQQDDADAARLRRMSAAQRVRPNPVIDSLTHYAEQQRAQDLADEKHLAAPLALSPSASLVNREHKQAAAEEAIYQRAVNDALGVRAPKAGVGRPRCCTVPGRT